MKKLLSIFIASILLAAPQVAKAQVDCDMDNDFRGRIGAEVDYKLVSGLHVSVSEEARFADNFTSFDRFMTSAYMSYKPIKYLKFGVGYTFMSMLDCDLIEGSDYELKGKMIEKKDGQMYDQYWDLRHRAFADVTGMYKVDGWSFSLRERYQITARIGDFNEFQSPKLERVLRSRAKVSYGFRSVPLEPYVAFEARLLFNGINTDSLARTNAEAQVEGYEAKFDQKYFNRYRSQVGLEYKLNSHHAFDFYVLGDYWKETKADTNQSGKLKKFNVLEDGRYVTYEAIYHKKGFNTSIGIAYQFSF